MDPSAARTAIFNATIEMLKLNEKVGNALPKEIVQCVNGEARVSSDIQMSVPSTISGQSGGARRTRRQHRKAHRKTQIRRHK